MTKNEDPLALVRETRIRMSHESMATIRGALSPRLGVKIGNSFGSPSDTSFPVPTWPRAKRRMKAEQTNDESSV